MIAPVFFTLMVIVESSMVSGYSQLSRPISDLGAYALYGSTATLQNLNFWVFGTLVIAFAFGLRRGLSGANRVAGTMILFGAMVFLAGLFPDQPSPYPGTVHVVVSIVAFLSVIACQLLTWNHLRQASAAGGWSGYGTLSLATGLLSAVLLIAFASGANSPLAGLVQRLFVAVPWIWLEVVALKLYRL